MPLLTSEGERIVDNLSHQHGISSDAVTHMLMAVNAGYGTQAQFNHPEVGGMGQWSQGGMTMVGDMFNNGLRFLVDQLCSELSGALANGNLIKTVPPQTGSSSSFQMQGMQGGSRWPAELGQPSSVGAQNNLRYALFPQTRRLAIDANGQISVYDTGDHNITGFSQQQSGDQSITFTSQYGLVRVADLAPIAVEPDTPPHHDPAVSPKTTAPQETHYDPAPIAPSGAPDAVHIADTPAPASITPSAPSHSKDDAEEIIDLIEKLASLHGKGILTDTEFETKKSELLSRL